MAQAAGVASCMLRDVSDTGDGDLWIFGYGSLVWRPAFEFEEQRPGWIWGWARRFWQGSTDHRGTPQAPGRVVTVVPQPGARCWGVAYRVGPRVARTVLARLDHREKGGYRREHVAVELDDGRHVGSALMYLATPDNENYVGPAPLEEIAAQVRRCHGPSGPNTEYVLRLADALQRIGATPQQDEHVFELAQRVRAAESSTA